MIDLVTEKDETTNKPSSYEVLTPLLPLRDMEAVLSFEKKLKQDSVFKSQLVPFIFIRKIV